MTIHSEELSSIMTGIWTSMLGLELVPSATAPVDENHLTACISILGTWEGTMSLEFPATLARQLAGAMFDQDAAGLTESDVSDAVGELANIAGGNFKSVLPEGSQLTLPTVISGKAFSLNIPNSHVVSEQGFVCEGKPLVLRIHERRRGGVAP